MSLSTTRRSARAGRRGFTLIELVIVIAVIAILAALLTPVILGLVERARIATARASLAELARTMKRVRDDSGYWPYHAGLWSPAPNADSEIKGMAFGSGDTVMQSGDVPIPTSGPPLVRCAAAPPGWPCWNGPYMSQGDMGSLVDPWGNQYMFMFIRPNDGYGGGISQAPNGVVMVWSNGPDGIDQTACTTGGCGFDSIQIAQGLSSMTSCNSGGTPGSCSDDVIQYIASSLY